MWTPLSPRSSSCISLWFMSLLLWLVCHPGGGWDACSGGLTKGTERQAGRVGIRSHRAHLPGVWLTQCDSPNGWLVNVRSGLGQWAAELGWLLSPFSFFHEPDESSSVWTLFRRRRNKPCVSVFGQGDTCLSLACPCHTLMQPTQIAQRKPFLLISTLPRCQHSQSTPDRMHRSI